MSIVPKGATLEPGHWWCWLRSHLSLEVEYGSRTLASGGTESWVEAARCGDCGREQTKLIVRYPTSYTITVNPRGKG